MKAQFSLFNFKPSIGLSAGFTLIEVVVVLSILGIIITSSFAVSNTYTQTQKLNSATDNLRNNLNEAKSNALSGFIYQCTSAQSLYGYKLNVDSASSYSLYEICVDSVGNQTQSQLSNKVFTLPSGVTFSNSIGTNVIFLAVTGRPFAPSSFTLTNGTPKTVTVDATGIIQ